MTTEIEVTNEEIALAIGYVKGTERPDLCWVSPQGDHYPEVPDFRGSYATLEEAERVCRERRIGWMHFTKATEVETLLTWSWGNQHSKAIARAATLPESWWTSIVEAVRALRAEAEEEGA